MFSQGPAKPIATPGAPILARDIESLNSRLKLIESSPISAGTVRNGAGVFQVPRRIAAGGGGVGHVRIRFTIESTSFAVGLGQTGCDFVNATVTYISCAGSGVAVGDEVHIFDPEYCHFNLPIEILVGLCGTATQMDSAAFLSRTSYGLADCTYELAGASCMWMIDTLCCAEEELI